MMNAQHFLNSETGKMPVLQLPAVQENQRPSEARLIEPASSVLPDGHQFTAAEETAGVPTTSGHNSTLDPDAAGNFTENMETGKMPVLHDGEIVAMFEGAVGKPRDEWRVEEANRRLKIVETFNELIAQGKTKAEAAELIGVDTTSIWRYRKAFEAKGYAGLLPATGNCGRDSWLDKLGLTPQELQALMNMSQGLNLDTDSITTSLRVFASSPECPPRLAEVILDPNRCSKHAIPRSIRDAAKVPQAVKDAHRGQRRLALKGFYIPRKLDIVAGDVMTSDDTTPIWAWWVPWRECEEYPFGVKLLQGQFLPILDIASQDTPCGVLIAREKSSYRAADIWHLFGHLFDEVGLPRLGFQLERGCWEANVIRGQEVSYEKNEVSLSRRIGGLRQLPCNPHDRLGADFVWPKTLETFTSYLPKSKSIEAFFNRSQTLEGTLWGCLGRDQMRNPYEKTKKLFEQCSRPRTKMDPRNYFLSNEEIVKHVAKLLDHLRNEPMEGRVFKGIPRLNFENAINELPLFRMPEESRWMYRRNWTVLTITQGWAHVRMTHPVTGEQDHLFYCNPSFFADMEGQEVAVYYDREKCTCAAQIVAASRFKAKGQIYEPGDYVCEAPYFDPPGMFMGTRTGHEIAKAWRNAVMSTYFTLVKHAPSRQLPTEISQRRQEAKHSTVHSPQSAVVDNRPAAVPAGATVFGSKIKAPTDEQRRQRSKALRGEAQLLRNLSGLE